MRSDCVPQGDELGEQDPDPERSTSFPCADHTGLCTCKAALTRVNQLFPGSTPQPHSGLYLSVSVFLHQCFSRFRTTHVAEPTPNISNSVGWEQYPRFCIYNKFPCDDQATGPGTTLRECLLCTRTSILQMEIQSSEVLSNLHKVLCTATNWLS